MKTKYYLVVATVIMLGLASCKKDNTHVQNNQIIGKWYVNKLAIKEQTTGTGIATITDTTYLSNDFTADDYFKFNSDTTSAISGYGTFFHGYDVSKTTAESEIPFSYFVKGSTLTLHCLWLPDCNTGSNGCNTPILTETILKLDAHNLVIRDVQQGSNSTYKITTDTYYTRGN
ncbi:MAG: hypothetical protein JWR09_1641 [Mucilaginibacter sp.]|nr:hypothetical protein [Mucilaginibacter sp.]